jgi:enamine deaminase RidA (YjgF/YER057c/UK114 family)
MLVCPLFRRFQLFGKDDLGHHARSALGFGSLPTGVAVEVEAIFEVV